MPADFKYAAWQKLNCAQCTRCSNALKCTQMHSKSLIAQNTTCVYLKTNKKQHAVLKENQHYILLVYKIRDRMMNNEV